MLTEFEVNAFYFTEKIKHYFKAYAVVDLLEIVRNTFGTYPADVLTAKISSFLNCKVDNDIIVDESVLASCFGGLFGRYSSQIVPIIRSYIYVSPAIITWDVNVNTNGIESHWAHIRRHDGNRGGKFSFTFFD